MPLSEQQISEINAVFLNDADAQEAVLRAQPNGAGLQLVATALVDKHGQETVQKLAVFYSFDPTRNPPSRSGATVTDQPVRGVLVSDGGPDVIALNADPAIIGVLCFPEVFPSRLRKVRQQWMACAGRTVPDATNEDIDAAASSIGLRLSLKAVAGGPTDGDCKGSSCPVKVQVKGG